MKEMNLGNVSSEELVSMFEIAFEEQVAKLAGINEYGVSCEGRNLNKPIQMNVEVSGYAGTPTIDEFKRGEVEGSDSVTIHRDDIGEKKFLLVPSLTTFISGNDYLIVYESV